VNDEIKITAEVDKLNISTCRFTVDRPVYTGRATFNNAEEAKGNALAERLFRIEEVVGVELLGSIVVLTCLGGRGWREIGPQVGSAIREFIASGKAPSEEQYKASLPDPALLREKVRELLELQINPGVASHGGYVELIDVKDHNAYVRMGGGCQGCGAADVTLKQGIETLIRDEVPEIWQVIDITDHAAGTNPYYEAAK
jgi:Fe-S cluster biogenesis protein NfuA